MSPNRELEFVLKAQQLSDAGYLEDHIHNKLVHWGLSLTEAEQVMAKAKSQRFDLPVFSGTLAPELPVYSKRKLKHQKDSFKDKFILLRRDFAFDVNASPENLIKALQQDSIINKMWINRGRLISQVYRKQDGGWHAELNLEGQNRYGASTSVAKATATISTMSDAKSCHFEGTVINSNAGAWVFVILILIFMLGFFALMRSKIPSETPFIGLLALGVVIFFGSLTQMTMYASRNYLLELIQEAIKRAEKETNG